MSSIQSLGISGVRGYTPQNYQKIEFMKPLTLIWGKNGSGKTTIIQCLKYITTGALPPNSDKGKSFVMDTKIAGRPEVIGDIRLIFRAGNRAILAKRRMQLSVKGNTSKFQSIEQLLKTKGQKGEQITINHQCAQIQKQVPQFLGISKPILQNIVFCHQDESLWPFGDSTLLKNIFDELFQTKKLTKQMQKMWQVHKQQQNELKQLKIRNQYQKQTFHRQLNQRSNLVSQLEELNIKSKQLSILKEQIIKMESQVKDNKDKVQQRQKMIHKKGILENSIQNFQEKCRKWKQKLYKLTKQLQQKLKGKNISNSFIQQQSFSTNINYSNNNYNILSFNANSISINNPLIQLQIEKLQISPIQSVPQAMQISEQKKIVFKQLVKKLQSCKQNLQNMKTFNQSTKRQKQIKSQIDRIKSIVPEFKYNANRNVGVGKADEEFLKSVKAKLTQIQENMKSRQICKRKLSSIQLPNFVTNGLSQKQLQLLKKQSKELQAQIQNTSVIILKIYKFQYKQIPDGIDRSQNAFKQGQRIQAQYKNLEAIIKSKQDELKHYQSQPKSQHTNIQQEINHYKYAGIQLQQQMLHFCMQKKKCYFCMRQMKQSQIQTARQKVQSIKSKTHQRIQDLQNKRASQNHAPSIDPQMMTKKLKQQLSQLYTKYNNLKLRVSRFNETKQYKKQLNINNILQNQLKKCKLNLGMLDKLGHVSEMDKNTDSYYINLQIEEYVQLCSIYQIKTTRYMSIKEQVMLYQNNQQKNQHIKQKRQNLLIQRQQLIQAIEKAQSQVKNYDFLRNSYQKLDTLLKMQVKSKNKKSNQNYSVKQSQSSGKYSTIEQAEHQINNLQVQIFREQFEIEKLQIQLGYNNQKTFLEQQKQKYRKLLSQLIDITNLLSTQQSILDEYNKKSSFFQKQSQKIILRIQAINPSLNQPLQHEYLITANKIKHLQASIINIQLLYRYMEQAVSQYHAEKMQEINRYIYQIWREIYHGEDIEYIEIQASAEKDSKKKKKNYQYRILMKKSTKNFREQELVEMKGRCSMGQRVLASIVIRLALAQVFSTSTRILALDQPTTNLDRQHIKNLSISLLRLIQISGGKNLQLIIISHDMEFIKMLEQYADSYYEISRDQNRFSKIQKRSIKDLFVGAHDVM